MEKGWTEVFMTAHQFQAEIAKDMLENEGISAVIFNQHDSSYQTFGEITVYVPDSDAEKALQLLKKLKN
jgi:aspartokinase